MNRSSARELALHIILDMDYTNDTADAVIATLTDRPYADTLVPENELYAESPSSKQKQYILSVACGVEENNLQLEEYINRYSIDWKAARISRITKSILKLAMFEIQNVEDVPASVACNEAVNLTKKYDSDEAAAFVNGILGSFIRGEVSQ